MFKLQQSLMEYQKLKDQELSVELQKGLNSFSFLLKAIEETSASQTGISLGLDSRLQSTITESEQLKSKVATMDAEIIRHQKEIKGLLERCTYFEEKYGKAQQLVIQQKAELDRRSHEYQVKMSSLTTEKSKEIEAICSKLETQTLLAEQLRGSLNETIITHQSKEKEWRLEKDDIWDLKRKDADNLRKTQLDLKKMKAVRVALESRLNDTQKSFQVQRDSFEKTISSLQDQLQHQATTIDELKAYRLEASRKLAEKELESHSLSQHIQELTQTVEILSSNQQTYKDLMSKMHEESETAQRLLKMQVDHLKIERDNALGQLKKTEEMYRETESKLQDQLIVQRQEFQKQEAEWLATREALEEQFRHFSNSKIPEVKALANELETAQKHRNTLEAHLRATIDNFYKHKVEWELQLKNLTNSLAAEKVMRRESGEESKRLKDTLEGERIHKTAVLKENEKLLSLIQQLNSNTNLRKKSEESMRQQLTEAKKSRNEATEQLSYQLAQAQKELVLKKREFEQTHAKMEILLQKLYSDLSSFKQDNSRLIWERSNIEQELNQLKEQWQMEQNNWEDRMHELKVQKSLLLSEIATIRGERDSIKAHSVALQNGFQKFISAIQSEQSARTTLSQPLPPLLQDVNDVTLTTPENESQESKVTVNKADAQVMTSPQLKPRNRTTQTDAKFDLMNEAKVSKSPLEASRILCTRDFGIQVQSQPDRHRDNINARKVDAEVMTDDYLFTREAPLIEENKSSILLDKSQLAEDNMYLVESTTEKHIASTSTRGTQTFVNLKLDFSSQVDMAVNSNSVSNATESSRVLPAVKEFGQYVCLPMAISLADKGQMTDMITKSAGIQTMMLKTSHASTQSQYVEGYQSLSFNSESQPESIPPQLAIPVEEMRFAGTQGMEQDIIEEEYETTRTILYLEENEIQS
jgi:hypothetical protein